MKRKKLVFVICAVAVVAIICGVLFFTLSDTIGTKNITDNNAEIPLLDQMKITKISNMSGVFVEDGNDTEVDSVGAIILENTGSRTIQLANVNLIIDGESYTFSVTTLPPQKSAVLQELDKKTLPEEYSKISADTDSVVLFDKEPDLYENIFEITGEQGAVTIKNISDTAINGPIYIYYKNTCEDGYAGGITYRTQIPTLDAGATFSANTSHFYSGNSQVMFVDYVQ